MKSAFRLLPVALVATFAVAGAQAQSSTSSPSQSGERASMLPYTHNGYTGISAGRSKYDLSTGPVGMAYDNSDTAFKIYTGGVLPPQLGCGAGLPQCRQGPAAGR